MKRHSEDQTSASVAFNFEDVSVRCEEYKTQVKEECRQLVLKTQRQADEIRWRAESKGQSQGYRDGLSRAETEIAEQGRQIANKLVEERLSTVVPAVSEMLGELICARNQCRLDWETELVGVAVAIAEKIIRTSLQLQPDLTVGVVEQAVELAMGSTSLQIQLHPSDLESLGDRIRGVVQDSSRGVEVKLVPDAGVSPGGCLIATDRGQIDGQLETMLERISSELLEGLQ
jgi:flagellar biosynthesis/type III secretory pathway protein FliH